MTSGFETIMALRWFKRFFLSTEVIIATLLFRAELATAVYSGQDLSNPRLAVPHYQQ